MSIEGQRAQAGEFLREDRYIVIKRKDLDAAENSGDNAAAVWVADFRSALRMVDPYLPNRRYLVIESDWPEHGPTWAAIQARVIGQGAQIEDEREAFSAWAHEKGFCLDCAFFEEGNNFEDPDTRLAYEIWLARAALATPPAAQDDGGRGVGSTHPVVRGTEHE